MPAAFRSRSPPPSSTRQTSSSKRDSSTALMVAIGRTGSKVMNRLERSAKFAFTEFSEDEMRRPTPYAVPLEGLQWICGLFLAGSPFEKGGSAHDGWLQRATTDYSRIGHRRQVLLPLPHRHRERRGYGGGEAAHYSRDLQTTLGLRAASYAHSNRGWNSLAVCEQGVRGVGSRVLVANDRRIRLIYANKRKPDEMDAETLARLQSASGTTSGSWRRSPRSTTHKKPSSCGRSEGSERLQR